MVTLLLAEIDVPSAAFCIVAPRLAAAAVNGFLLALVGAGVV